MFTIKKPPSFKYLKLFGDGHSTHYNSSSQGSGNIEEKSGRKLINIQKSGKTFTKLSLHMTGSDTQFSTAIIAYTIHRSCTRTVSSLFQHSKWRSSLQLIDKLRTVENCQGRESQFSSEIGSLVSYPYTVDSPTAMEIWTRS